MENTKFEAKVKYSGTFGLIFGKASKKDSAISASNITADVDITQQNSNGFSGLLFGQTSANVKLLVNSFRPNGTFTTI